MDRRAAESLINDYFNGWKQQNKELSLHMLTDDCEISECYGPVYRGIGEIEDWFVGWHADGGRVLQWGITNIIFDGDKQSAAVDWSFECLSQNKKYAFYGCSLIVFRDGKISQLKEYQMEKEKQYPYAK